MNSTPNPSPTDDFRKRNLSVSAAEDERIALAELIWRTSRADEGTISATGADHLARTIITLGWTMTGADEVERLRDAVKVLEGAWSICDDERDEARAEADRLRAELAESEREHEKSLAIMEAALDQRDEARVEVERLRGGTLEVDRLVKALQEFDPSDDYHRGDPHTPDYYAAIDRAIKLVRGEIHEWTDQRADEGNPGRVS